MTERTVTINADYFGPGDGVYVIDHGEHVSTLGFDVVLGRIERIEIELDGRLGTHPGRPQFARGSVEAYDHLQNLMVLLEKTCDEQGERAVFDLNPQLMGLEGHRVRVVGPDGVGRQFIVGKSTGWAPVHLEIKRVNSSGGEAISADEQFERVSDLGRVR